MKAEASEIKKIGLFGGTFNPLHIGHIQSMMTVIDEMQLDHLYAIPANKNPLKEKSPEIPSAEQRLEMVRRGLADYQDSITVDAQEVSRGGESFTVDTINKYSESHAPEDIYLIIGMDEFAVFDQWKSFDEILAKVNLVVTSRPGTRLPRTVEELPPGIQKQVAAFDRGYIELKTERHLQFVELEDVDISASEIRKRIRTGKKVDRYLPFTVEDFIQAEGLYRRKKGEEADYLEITKLTANTLFKHKGIRVRAFDLREMEAPCEFAVIVSGTSTRHAQSLSQRVSEAVKDQFGLSTVSTEGQSDGRWVLLDYGALIVHVFYDYVREEYRLEELWQKGKDLQLTDPDLEKAAPTGQ